jgi:hypothetical protein
MAHRIAFTVRFTAADGMPDVAFFNSREAAERSAQALQDRNPIGMHLVGEDPPVKLSEAQKRFLADFAREGRSLCPGGFHDSMVRASAWWRTARALQDMGLVKLAGSVALLTWRGLAWAVEA